MNVPDSLDALRASLQSSRDLAAVSASRPVRGARRAAVLALLFHADPGLRLIVIEKSGHLRKHAGQVAFPGGAVEPSDPTPVAAALREAHEEVGIYAPSVDVLGTLPGAHIAASGYDVSTVVGWWREPVWLQPVDIHEVAAVHSLLIEHLSDPANRLTWYLEATRHEGPGFLVDGLFVWGFTAHLIDVLLDLAGWSQPWDTTRREAVPRRFFCSVP